MWPLSHLTYTCIYIAAPSRSLACMRSRALTPSASLSNSLCVRVCVRLCVCVSLNLRSHSLY